MASDVFRQVYEKVHSDEVPSGGIMADIGSKDGIIAANLAEEFDCRSLSMDITFQPESRTRGTTEFVQGDGTNLPLADDTVDAVVSNMVFEHVPDNEDMIREAARVLKPSGLFVAIFPNRACPLDSHSFPPGTPWLPRRFTLRLFSA